MFGLEVRSQELVTRGRIHCLVQLSVSQLATNQQHLALPLHSVDLVVKYVNAQRESAPEFAREKIEVQATQTNQYRISDSPVILCLTPLSL